MKKRIWYMDGLRFECLGCGNCCTGAPGDVRIHVSTAAAMAAYLHVSLEDFWTRYTRELSTGEISLLEKANYDCIFFGTERKCQVYPVRPTQCRKWPFWRSTLHSPVHWKRAAKSCPGMNRGSLYTASRIQRISRHDGTSGILWPVTTEKENKDE